METHQSTPLFTPKQLADRHQWLTIGTLRKYLCNRKFNGLADTGAVIALSQRKLLIDEPKFIEWVRSHGES